MKNSFKLIVACFISILLIFNGTSSSKIYATGGTMSVGIGKNFSASGTQVSLPVMINNLPESGLSAANFVIEFDEELMLNDVKAGEIISTSSDLSYYVKFNKIYILFSDSSGGTYPIKKDGNLCYLNFGIRAGSSKDSFTIRRIAANSEMFTDNYLREIKPEFHEGSISRKDKLYRVQTDKTWKVTFNQEIDPKSMLWDSYQIKDVNGQSILTKHNISRDGKTLEILPPEKGYELYKSYTLILRNTINSKYGRSLSKEEIVYFYVDR